MGEKEWAKYLEKDDDDDICCVSSRAPGADARVTCDILLSHHTPRVRARKQSLIGKRSPAVLAVLGCRRGE